MHFCKLEPLMRTALLSLCLVVAVGCNVKNPNYCEDGPDHLCDQPDAKPMVCEMSSDCTGAAKVCDNNECVECTAAEDDACTGAKPVCDTTARTCRACAEHADCPSRVCQPDGSCAAATAVAYVDAQAGQDANNCEMSTPCRTVMTASSKGKQIIKLKGNLDEAVSFGSGTNFTLFADPNTKLTRSGGGTVVDVSATANITIHDLEINGGGIGIAMSGNPQLVLEGIRLSGCTQLAMQVSTGSFTLSRSNIINNPGGGIQISGGVFKVVGNTFTNNGSDSANVGGMYINAPQNAMHRIEFNSFHRNKTIDAQGTGLHCAVNNLVARNNILFGNGTLTNPVQIGGACTHSYSLIEPNPPTTGNNIGGNPLFKDGLMGDLRLMAGSPALGAADPNVVFDDLSATDIDDQKRVKPADIGADEAP